MGLAASASCASKSRVDNPQQRPNIVWIVVEDMSCNFGYQGERTIETPNVDRLAREGAQFTRAYVTCPVCSPCRSAMITGMYQTSIGAHNHRSYRGTIRNKLPEPYRLIPEYLKDAGYYVCNGYNADAKVTGKTDYNFDYPEDLYDGSDWSGRAPDQPFFAQFQLRGGKIRNVKMDRPVDPADVTLPPYYPDDPLIREDWARYLNSVKHADDEVGIIMSRLKAEGLADNTIVFFLTDHGVSHVRGKQFCYEEGARVPLIVWAPGRLSGDIRSELVSHIDIAASSLHFAGVPIPKHLEARPLFGPGAKPRDFVVTARDRCDETVDRIRSVRKGRFNYIRNYLWQRPYLQPSVYKDKKEIVIRVRALHAEGKLNRDQSLMLAESRPQEELYDLEKDPYELNNLAGDEGHATVLAEMRGILDRWVVDSGDHGATPESEEVYDDAMEVYFETKRSKDGADHPGIRVFESNIAQMKRWAAEGI
jgi:arylsulfatase A-like enzyme